MSNLPEQRCPTCNHLLYRGYVMRVQIKCPSCKSICYFEILELKQKINEYINKKKEVYD